MVQLYLSEVQVEKKSGMMQLKNFTLHRKHGIQTMKANSITFNIATMRNGHSTFSLRGFGWPRTHKDSLASISQMLGLEVCVTTSGT